MTESPLNLDLSDLMADLERHRDAAIRTQQDMLAAQATVTSANGLVTATVGGQGELRELKFGSRKYRDLAPAELANIIVETVEKARRQVMTQVLGDVPTRLFGISTEDLLNGTADAGSAWPGSAGHRPGKTRT